ncbi:glycosyltransferase family 4 protein [Cohnella cellulosilytica]|uniref:Glycosyltransferase family 4 protein n=1 Tax=Cohnella cellulosilytica TaxID=986710 RepID=A0ABW2FK29_9BACL
MNVLYVTNIPSPYRIDFFNELARSCSLTVWFQAPTEANRQWEVRLDRASFAYKFLPGMTFGLDKHFNWTVRKELRESKFDVYVLGCYSSPTEMTVIRWLKSRKRPFLLNTDGGFPGHENRIKHWLKRSFISAADGWLSSGRNGTAYLLHYGAKSGRIWEYPFSSSAYTEEQLRPYSREEKEQFKRRHGLKERVLLSVGQFIERKGFEDLLTAYSSLDNGKTSLVLIGGGPLKERYERTIRDKRLRNVQLLEFMDAETLTSFYRSADVFVMPTRYDIWGLVLNEALAFGLPIVTTRGAGAAYSLVEHGVNGFVTAVGDVAGIARGCRALLRDESLRERFGQAARNKAEGYTVARMAERHLEIFETMLEQRQLYGPKVMS